MSERPGRGRGVHFEGDLRATLVSVAVDALDAVGIEALSLRELARRAGVSHAAPAHHFGNRRGLLTAVATEGFRRFTEHLAPVLLGAAPDHPEAVLPALAAAYSGFAERYPGLIDLMFRPGLIDTDDPDYVATSDLAFAALRDHVITCQAAGWRRDADPTALAAAGWSLAHGISVLRIQGSLARHQGDLSLDAVAAMAAALLDLPVGPVAAPSSPPAADPDPVPSRRAKPGRAGRPAPER